MTPIDNGGIPAFVGETDDRRPMGLAMYTRPSDGAIFAIVSRKFGPSGAYLWQYLLEDAGDGTIKATKVRAFGDFIGGKEIEALAVDNELGYVYYSDEMAGVHKYHADPDAPGANEELAFFGTDGFAQDHEGISIYKIDDGTGYILVSDQQANAFRIFKREGEPGDPAQPPTRQGRSGFDQRERRFGCHEHRSRSPLSIGSLCRHVRQPDLPLLLVGRHRRRRSHQGARRGTADSVTLPDHRPFDVLLFDLGGVLMDFVGFDELAQFMSGAPGRSEIRDRWIRCEAVRRFERGEIARDEFATSVLEELEIDLLPSDFLRYFVDWAREPSPEAVSLLRRLGRDYRIAALSNANELHTPLHRRRFEHVIGTFYFSDEIGIVKPDREIFEHVIRDLGVPPHRIAFFDDTPVNVEAAREAGLIACAVDGIAELTTQLKRLGVVDHTFGEGARG